MYIAFIHGALTDGLTFSEPVTISMIFLDLLKISINPDYFHLKCKDALSHINKDSLSHLNHLGGMGLIDLASSLWFNIDNLLN